MKEMDLWNESILLDGNWGLDLPFHQENGPFGDLKPEGHVDGTDHTSFQLQEAAEQSFPSDSISEDGLGLEWMESMDFSVFLEKLDSAKLLPLESTLQELTSLSSELPVVVNQAYLKTPSILLSSEVPVCSDIGFDALVSAPESPEQVTPVIQLSSENDSCKNSSGELGTDTSIADISSSLWDNQDFLGDLDFSSVSHVDEPSFCLDPTSELVTSPLSADDVDSLLSVSEPASPDSINDKSSSIIKASPELYKVIATSSLDASKRYSPYQKQKPPKKEPKAQPRRRVPAQPVPEHVIIGQVNKKDRKKLQNKNAAIRYRQKKREEALGMRSEEQELEDYNSELKTKVEDLEREIRYMQNLMEDICKAKGVVIR